VVPALSASFALFLPTVAAMAWLISRARQDDAGFANPEDRRSSRDLERQLSRNEFIEVPAAGA
jgi:hypothetical protein